MLDGLVLSIDAMGGDNAPDIVVKGIEYFLKHDGKNRRARFLLHGDQAKLEPLLAKAPATAARCEIRHTESAVEMDAKPSQALRKGKGTSMWNAVAAVKAKEANFAVSAGNTGALMAMSKLQLRMKPGVQRPAIAASWPQIGGFDVVVTDGFTGNIALKTAEGTAKLIGHFFTKALSGNLWSKFTTMLNSYALLKLKKQIDPRRANGGVFLGLNGIVVKSHGGTDHVGFANALGVAIGLAESTFLEEIDRTLEALHDEDDNIGFIT